MATIKAGAPPSRSPDTVKAIGGKATIDTREDAATRQNTEKAPMIRYHSAGIPYGRELDVKAASQQRRTLGFKEGLQELKKAWGLSPEPQPEQKPQTAKDKPARDGDKPSGKPQARSRNRPQTGKGQPGKPHGAKPQGGRPEGGKPEGNRAGARSQQRARPNKPLPADLSEEEKARIERNRRLNTVWNQFAKLYPAFRDRLPLKIGVLDDLATRHPDHDKALIVAVLKRHVNHPRYHEFVVAGGSRYELDGTVSPGAGIEPSHIGRAKAALARQKAKADAAKEAQKPGSNDAKPAAPATAQSEPVQVEPAQVEPAQSEPVQPAAPAADDQAPDA